MVHPSEASRLGMEVHPRPVPTSTRSPSVSWHPLLQSASEEALAMARSASFALPDRSAASPTRGATGHQTPPVCCRSPNAGHMHFPKATSFISLRTINNENVKRVEATEEKITKRLPQNRDRGVRVENPKTSPRLGTGEGKTRPPPLQLTSLTTPPTELPAQLAAEYEEEDEVIGEGAFAVVRRLRHRRTQSLVALKVVEKYPLYIRSMMGQLEREVRIQGQLRHPHILQLLSIVEDDRYLYMLLEHCPGGSLRSLCARQPHYRLGEGTAARYFAQILQGVEFMHRKCYVHRDLKEENMLLTSDDEVRICDFGWSAEVQAEKALKTTCGTPHYWPPEIFNNECQDTAVDLWALGTLVYELLVGHQPFWGSKEEIKKKVLAVDLRYPPNLLTEEAISVFKGLMQRDPRRRTPARELLEECPWVARALEPRTPAEGCRTRKAFTPPAPRIGASMIDTTASRAREVSRQPSVKTEKYPERQPAVQAVRSGPLRSQLPSQVVAPIIRPPPEAPQSSPAPLSAALPNSMTSMFFPQEPLIPPLGVEAQVFRQGPLLPRPCLHPPVLPFQNNQAPFQILPGQPARLAPGAPGLALGTAR
ncbi:AUR3 [Symbiodinium natans]|uniref:AUR3 protein n=1 Tax=Symbiodinium natans TaxID=878477 RepID=A0A812UEW7_9DINO|nr:AUR3 [Symbiodinium natans]